MMQNKQVKSKIYLMVKDPSKIKGDYGLSKQMQIALAQTKTGFWAICPYSYTSMLLKEVGDYFYVVDDIMVNQKKNTIIEDMAIEIAENCAKWGRIHITRAQDIMGAVRVDIEWGVPNLLWALYPRGVFGVIRAHWAIKALSFVTAPLFFLASPLVKWWQRLIYKSVYSKAFQVYAEFYNEVYRGMQYPELLV